MIPNNNVSLGATLADIDGIEGPKTGLPRPFVHMGDPSPSAQAGNKAREGEFTRCPPTSTP